MSETNGWGPIRLMCGRCGATAPPDGATRDGLPRGWERFIIRGDRPYACATCVQRAESGRQEGDDVNVSLQPLRITDGPDRLTVQMLPTGIALSTKLGASGGVELGTEQVRQLSAWLAAAIRESPPDVWAVRSLARVAEALTEALGEQWAEWGEGDLADGVRELARQRDEAQSPETGV